jgi:hypothetical protein
MGTTPAATEYRSRLRATNRNGFEKRIAVWSQYIGLPLLKLN